MKLYREVKIEERYPEKEGNYNVKSTYGDHIEQRFFTGSVFVNYDGYRVTHWLEEVDLSTLIKDRMPSDEEMKIHMINYSANERDQRSFYDCFEWLKETLIKGE